VHHNDDGDTQIVVEKVATIRIYGKQITENTVLGFTDVAGPKGKVCDKLRAENFTVSSAVAPRSTNSTYLRSQLNESILFQVYDVVTDSNLGGITARADIVIPIPGDYYICVKDPNEEVYKHQGTETYKMVGLP